MTHNTAIRKLPTSVLGVKSTHSIDPFPDQNFVVAKNGTSDDWSCVITCEVRKQRFPGLGDYSYRHASYEHELLLCRANSWESKTFGGKHSNNSTFVYNFLIFRFHKEISLTFRSFVFSHGKIEITIIKIVTLLRCSKKALAINANLYSMFFLNALF